MSVTSTVVSQNEWNEICELNKANENSGVYTLRCDCQHEMKLAYTVEVELKDSGRSKILEYYMPGGLVVDPKDIKCKPCWLTFCKELTNANIPRPILRQMRFTVLNHLKATYAP